MLSGACKRFFWKPERNPPELGENMGSVARRILRKPQRNPVRLGEKSFGAW